MWTFCDDLQGFQGRVKFKIQPKEIEKTESKWINSGNKTTKKVWTYEEDNRLLQKINS